jgi:hypothetical protein
MVKPKYCFYYKREKIVMKKNVPVTLQSDEEVARLVGSGLVEEYEEVHPNGNLNITTKGQFDVKQYATVTVNPTIFVVVLWGGENLNDFSYMKFVSGETKSLPTAEEYLDQYEIPEGKSFAGWTTAKNDVETKIEGDLTPVQDMNLYALILDDAPEEIEEDINHHE